MAKSEATNWHRRRSKAYVETAPKNDERGTTRAVSASDTREQLDGRIVFEPVHNRFPALGLDVGDGPNQAM